MERQNPCFGCKVDDGRSPTCHSTCNKYKEWLKEHEEFLRHRNKEKFLEQGLIDFRLRSPKRMKNNKSRVKYKDGKGNYR